MGTSNSILPLFFLCIYISSISSSYSIISSSFPPEFSILEGQETDILSTEKVSELFLKWKELHGKTYEHEQEEELRLKNFHNSLKYVLEKNSKRKSELDHTVGLTKFADLSNEEFKEMYFSKNKGPRRSNKLKMGDEKSNTSLSLRTCNAPDSLDWRDKGVVTPIKDQGQCGSCWAFSVTGSMEGAYALATGELISLSEQELVDCDTYDYGCSGGNMDTAYNWIIKNGGLDSEADYPYTSSNGREGRCDKTKSKKSVVSIKSYEEVESNEDAVLCAAAQQPVTIGIVGSAYDFQLYTGGIYNGQCSSSPYDLDHAVLIVGYGSQDGQDYWIVKNQWGTYWGLDGYILMARNTTNRNGVCGMYLEPMYPITSAPPPPGPPAPPSPPPPPPSPTPSKCGDFSYCAKDQTCCCIFEFYDYCFMYGCCGYTNAVCCKGSSYCCPSDYPICDILAGYCYKSSGRTFGVPAKKRQLAKHKMPWEKIEQTLVEDYQPFPWKRNQFAVAA